MMLLTLGAANRSSRQCWLSSIVSTSHSAYHLLRHGGYKRLVDESVGFIQPFRESSQIEIFRVTDREIQIEESADLTLSGLSRKCNSECKASKTPIRRRPIAPRSPEMVAGASPDIQGDS